MTTTMTVLAPTTLRTGFLSRERLLGRTVHYLVLSAIAIVTIYPFWWTLITALSTEGDVYAFPPPLLPTNRAL